jgi:nicotinate dehydrogenase subunit B
MRSRREFLRDSGGLLIGFSLLDEAVLPRVMAAVPQERATAPSPDRLDGWLRINKDGGVQVLTGKVEIGMGVETALAQIVAEELDVPVERVSFVMGDTALTPDQGGVGGSTSISLGAKPLRNASATARAKLLQLASAHLGAPIDQLEVQNGTILVKGAGTRGVTYGELVARSGLNETLKTSGQGFALNAEGVARPKDPHDYRIVGTSVPRQDLSRKILGQFEFVTDVRLPNMVHGRVIRPSSVGATVTGVNDAAARAIRGFLKTIVKSNFVGVVAETEWAAVKAAKAVNVSWSEPRPVFSEHDTLYEHLRSTPPKSTRETLKQGDADAALASAAARVTASYDFPFQSHATMGPGCAVADVHVDGETRVWTGAQKPHAIQRAFAELLGVPLERVRIIWVEDAGSYGRAGFEDVAADAVLLSREVGRPVRVQWMRDDMTAWGPKGPPVSCDLSAALDARGEVLAVRFSSWTFSGNEIAAVPGTAGNYLGAQLAGTPATYGGDEFAEWGRQTAPYVFPNLHASAHVVPSFATTASPLRATHLRDPEGPATSFAVESFMDELASAARIDPIELRLKHLEEPRAKAVLTAAASRAGWSGGTSAKKPQGQIATGRGVGLSTRNGTYVGTIAEVEVDRRTGAVHVTRFVCAHDCGLIVNPEGLKRTIEANLLQTLSRSLMEEVTFDRTRVTSTDWNSYPVARIGDVPATIDIVLINRPDLPPGGAGEPACRAVAAAIANAIYDATGARVRRVPLTPARVKAALAKA